MRLISLDCEFNQPSQKTIQIGAVCFQPDNGKIVEEFMVYVDPGEPISPEITSLTRITDDHVVLAPSIVEAARQLTSFKQRLQINAIPIVWGAGKSNDVSKIYSEADVESPFRSRIIDVKGVFQMLANSASNDMRQKVGLKKACDLLGIGWNSSFGQPHDALADALNTMRVYMFLSKCLKGGFDIKKNLANFTEQKYL